MRYIKFLVDVGANGIRPPQTYSITAGNAVTTLIANKEKQVAEIDSQFNKIIVENEKKIVEIDNQKMPKMYITKILLIPLQTIILGFFLTSDGLLAQKLVLSKNLINLSSVEGEKLLLESQYRQDFLPLIIQFVTQKNQAYCGVASSIMVLNSLSIPLPVAPEYSPYRVFTQDNFFNEQTQKVIATEVVTRQGMTLEQLGKLLESHTVKAEVYHAADVTLEEFRRLVSKNLQESGNFVIVNYLRKAIGQETGGHISPIAAYNKETDRFLILDVSRYKYPPVWVKASELWKAMATIDLVSGKTRGFVLISPLL